MPLERGDDESRRSYAPGHQRIIGVELDEVDVRIEGMVAASGRPSILTARLLLSKVFTVSYTILSERRLRERLP